LDYNTPGLCENSAVSTPFQRPIEAEELRRLLDECGHGRLITVDERGAPACGLFHFLAGPGWIEFHIRRDNPQQLHLGAGRGAVFEADDYLSPIPSHWLERHDGAAFTALYRLAVVSGRFSLDEDRAALAAHFTAFLRKYQPEGSYEPFSAEAAAGDSLSRFLLARLEIESVRGRWQLAQTRPPELRRKLADKLRTRGRGGDPRAADELLRWLMLHPEEDVDPLKYE
jgi:predicted FMN-binding regulatory protein PaiB